MKKRGMVTNAKWLIAIFILCVIAGAAVAQEGDVPEWISETTPEDVFWGIGSSKLEDESRALESAISQAQWDVAAQLGTKIQSMAREYVSEEGAQIRETFVRETSNANFSGAVINAREQTADGTWWVRVSLSKADAQKLKNDAIGSEAVGIFELELPEPLSNDRPEWIDELPPEDALWGFGYAKMEDESRALEAAISQAQWDVAAQLGAKFQSMISEYVSEEGTLIRESFTREISNADLSGAVINAQEQTADGTWWVRVSLPKVDAQKLKNDAIGSEAERLADLKAREALKMLDAKIEQAQWERENRSGD